MATKKVVRKPIATWYRIESMFRAGIEPVQVVAFTDKTVTYLDKQWRFTGPEEFFERKVHRVDLFPSFDEAKTEFLRRAKRDVESAKENLQRKRSALGQVESLKPPATRGA